MTLKNATRWIRGLSLCGLVVAVASESDLTNPGRTPKPEFVLLTPGTVAQVSAGSGHTCAVRTEGTVACWGSKVGPGVGFSGGYLNAGSDQTVLLGVLYTLSASFSEPDNGPWSYTINWGDGPLRA